MAMTIRCLAVAMVVLAAGASLAQEGAAPSAEQQAMMEAYQRAATPGEQHASLAKMAGEYTLKIKMFGEPGTEPQVSTGTASRRMILGGRYLEETVHAMMMGEHFEGIGLTGYDNVTGSWWGTWVDTMSTGMMISRGDWDEAAGVGTFVGEYPDAMTGGVQKARTVTRRLPGGDELMEMYMIASDGEVKSMEILYQRK